MRKKKQAPSEKHLERWIIENCRAIPHVAPQVSPYLIDRILGNQVALPSGICDLLALSAYGYLVVAELKVGLIDEVAIAQVLRYAGALRDIASGIITDWQIAEVFGGDKASPYPDIERIICPLLIGYGVKNAACLFLAQYYNMNIVLYEYNGTDYDFYYPPYRQPHYQRYQIAEQVQLELWLEGVIKHLGTKQDE